jgi:hypothetical protein
VLCTLNGPYKKQNKEIRPSKTKQVFIGLFLNILLSNFFLFVFFFKGGCGGMLSFLAAMADVAANSRLLLRRLEIKQKISDVFMEKIWRIQIKTLFLR